MLRHSTADSVPILSNLALLPTDMLIHIFCFLTPEALSAVAAVSARFHELVNRNMFWRKQIAQHFPHHYKNLVANRDTIDWREQFRDCYKQDYEDVTPSIRKLFSIIKNSDIEALTSFKLPLAMLDEQDAHGVTLLEWAQIKKSRPVLNYFYQRAQQTYQLDQNRLNTSKTMTDGRTILYWAIALDQTGDTIRSLLLQGSSFMETYDRQYNPVHIAAKMKISMTPLMTLLKENPAVRDQIDIFNQTPLLLAAAAGHAQCVDYLIAEGAAPNVATVRPGHVDDRKSPIYWAAERGYLAIVNSLLAAGAIVTQGAGVNRYLPIHAAAINGHLDIVKALVRHQPNSFDLPDAYQQTPLLWAAAKGHASCIDYLIEQGADINVRTKLQRSSDHHKTALYWAVERGHEAAVVALLRAGVNAKRGNAFSAIQPIHVAAKQGHLNLVKLLIAYDPSLLEAEDALDQTPLIWAAAQGHTGVVEHLLSHGANIHATTAIVVNDNRTALYWAAKNGHSHVVHAILQHNSNVSLANIMTTNLNHFVKTEIKLCKYIAHKERNLPHCLDVASSPKRLQAAQALKQVALHGAGRSTLTLFSKQLNRGHLKVFSETLGLRPKK